MVKIRKVYNREYKKQVGTKRFYEERKQAIKTNRSERKQNIKEKFEYKNAVRSLRSYRFGILGSILSIFLVALMFVSFIRISTGISSIPMFTELLESLSQVPPVEIPFINFQFSTVDVDSWFFQSLLEIANMVTRLLDVIIFLLNGIIQVITYVVYFFKWIFAL